MNTRTLSQVEKDIIEQLYREKQLFKPTHAYVTTTQELSIKRWNGEHPVDENTKIDKIPANTTLKIVMVSRLGDCGLTDNLNAEYGYNIRVEFDCAAIKDLRLKP